VHLAEEEVVVAIDPKVIETTTAMMRAKPQEAVGREENTTHPVATTEVVDAVATKRGEVVSEVAKTDQWGTTEMAETEVAIAAVVQAIMMTQKPQEEEL